MNILLIAGGWSSERDVALNGGKIIHAALESLGHATTFYDPANSLDDLPAAASGKDFAFINLHGSPGEDGLIQAMLEQLGAHTETIEAPFQPEHGAYGGGHHHSRAGEEDFNYAPRLHQFGVRL